ncbi:hypothetical protein HP062_05540 [Pseudomonas sp. B14-6]|uniref:hypothetical protein n=1 Tax=Pseudomonas sp. B14-6 TaxID=2738843 RepID=UPI00155E3DA3|nr:hypothetical protein [Pseudomonas sp. B14-6]QKG65095.1 hypothetical protein HP062_05540 [Pseudomonas sp. B14-6]
MNKSALQAYVEGEINLAAKRIIDKGAQSDEIAYGRLKVNLSLRRILVEAPTPEDLGLWGASMTSSSNWGFWTVEKRSCPLLMRFRKQ